MCIAGSKAIDGKFSGDGNLIINEFDFMSAIITQDEYSVSKVPSSQTKNTSEFEIKPTTELNHGYLENQLPYIESSSLPLKTDTRKSLGQPREGIKDDQGIQELSSSFESGLNINVSDVDKETKVNGVTNLSKDMLKSSVAPSDKRVVEQCVSMSERQSDVEHNESEDKSMQQNGEKSEVATKGVACASDSANFVDTEVEKVTGLSKNKPKSSLKTSGKKKLSRSVTWADEKSDSSGSKSLCEIREMDNAKNEYEVVANTDVADDELLWHRASAEACANALSNASEAVASGGSDVTDAGNYLLLLFQCKLYIQF